MKSTNWISATGRRPESDIPIAIPTIPASASGVSITRSDPNRAHSPSVARKTPPFFPMSSPRRTTRGSRSISRASASWIAWTSVIVATGSPLHRYPDPLLLLLEVPRHLRVDVLDQALRGHRGGRLARRNRPPHLLAGLLRDRGFGLVGEHPFLLEIGGEPADGGFPSPRLDLFLGPVMRRIVGGGVGAHPVGQRLDQGRPLPRSRPLQGIAGHPDDRQDVVAVHPDALKPPCRSLDRDRPGRGLLRERKRDGVLVVAAEEDVRGLEDPGKVHRDVELPRGAAAVTEVRDDRRLLPAQLGGVGDP